ncbi:hypothetical protein BD779DRAFT_1427583, partial [Infundibulicybe gibba]
LVNEVTTMRRHMEAYHKGVYQTWAEKNCFLSMLPKDSKQRKDQAAIETQSRLDVHLKPIPVKEKTIPYTDKLFRNAAVEWLVSTDQPIQALEHPSFQNMIYVAARATNGVKIPERRTTCEEIIDTFKQQLIALRGRLNV